MDTYVSGPRITRFTASVFLWKFKKAVSYQLSAVSPNLRRMMLIPDSFIAGGSKSTHATTPTRSGGLAVANGHVCSGAWDNALYCFGLPLEI